MDKISKIMQENLSSHDYQGDWLGEHQWLKGLESNEPIMFPVPGQIKITTSPTSGIENPPKSCRQD